jgi:hypothetical protein
VGCLFGGSPSLQLVLVSQMMANGAARRRAQEGVMVSEMSGDAPHHRALEAPFGIGRSSDSDERNGQGDGKRPHQRDSFGRFCAEIGRCRGLVTARTFDRWGGVDQVFCLM